MARKSKTQKAKASAARQARKAERKLEELAAEEKGESLSAAEQGKAAETKSKAELARKDASDKPVKKDDAESKKSAKKADEKKSEDKKPKKKRFQFLRDVKAELKRVTWPTRIDVMRWSGVVVAALVFFGMFVAILDNFVVTPLLVLLSGADPSSIDWFSALTGGDAAGVDSSSSADVSADASATGSEGDVAADGTQTEAANDAGAASDAASSEE